MKELLRLPALLCMSMLLVLVVPQAATAASADPLISTPYGYVPESCVHVFPSQTVIISNNVSTTAVLPNGTSITLPSCSAGSTSPSGPSPLWSSVPSSWDEWGDYNLTRAALYHFSGLWTVPSSPTSAGQDIYYWIGAMETGYSNYLFQPILQWEGISGGAYWSIISCIYSGQQQIACSTPVKVSSGNTINGTMQFTGYFCQPNAHACYDIIAKDTSTGVSSSLLNQDYNAPWDLFGTLESQQLSSCSDFPSGGGITLGSLSVWDMQGQLSPSWGTQVNANASPQCSFKVSATSTAITLDYS